MNTCTCKYCEFTKRNTNADVWIHKLTRPSETVLNLPKTFISTAFEKTKPIDFDILFSDPLFLINPKPSFGKPFKSCLWFSRGSWLYDPYCDTGHFDFENWRIGEYDKDQKTFINEQNAMYDQRDTTSVVYTFSPQNIYIVDTYEKIVNFPRQSDNITPDYIALEKQGYYGMATTFRKPSQFPEYNFERDKDLISWTFGFDVESLVVWDSRAFGEMYYGTLR